MKRRKEGKNALQSMARNTHQGPSRMTSFQVRYIGVSNETSYGVMEFVHAAKVEGLPKIVSIQNSYSLLVRSRFEVDLVEVCHPNNCNIGLLSYSPLGGGSLTGKYLDINSEAAKKGRLNLFPGYMERYNRSIAKASHGWLLKATENLLDILLKYLMEGKSIVLDGVKLTNRKSLSLISTKLAVLNSRSNKS
ncbi:hypothetical protein GIB67_032402 [Kingdonia uniflora]|uniref:NADP-dependent oxidoreductase domain-containing protein n=1 Tax=Kingdonia uniflora TaxID=39325 RepID=A0A7J7MJ17_9MAGN|nr:hypothetical protein GIB67_032402 [Kingdonia uniflora]